MDPRITAAWCKRHGVPIEKVFSKALREKFPWAMALESFFVYKNNTKKKKKKKHKVLILFF